MATVTGFTAERMLEIENNSVTSGLVDSQGRLLLSTKAGEQIVAGDVRGQKGDYGPTGVVAIFAGNNPPEGYLICDGSALSRTTYADLFAVIGTTYGGSPTTFYLPNLKGRVVVGVDPGDSLVSELGFEGGTQRHTLTSNEMPSHTHTQNSHTHTQNSHTHTQNSHTHTQSSHTHTQSSHTHDQLPHTHTQTPHGHTGMTVDSSNLAWRANPYSTGTNRAGIGPDGWGTASPKDLIVNATTAVNNSTTAENSGVVASNNSTFASNNSATAINNSTTAVNNSSTATNQNTGGGSSHNNMQPFLVLNYIIKT